jgi:pilus assembly protein CpaE
MTVKVSIVAPTPAAAQFISRDIAALKSDADVSVHQGSLDAACHTLMNGSPDILVIEAGNVRPAELRGLESALANSPFTSVILLTPDRSPETLLGAMRAGVRELVPLPLTNGEFKEAYARQLERRMAAQGAGRSEGGVVAFMPAKGGAGATFLATSFAHALSCNDKRVAIIDLNLHLGDAAVFVSDQPVTTTIGDLSSQEARLDGALLESMMLRCGDNLWLLASPDTPEAAVGVRADTVARVIALAQSRFDFVVLDVGRVPDSTTLRALEAARTIYLVAQSTLPFLHDGKRLLNMLYELGHARDKIELVINRVGKGGDITPADTRKTLGYAQSRDIPNGYANVSFAINHGLPILRHAPRDPVARAITAWADEIAPKQASAARGWLRGFGASRS